MNRLPIPGCWYLDSLPTGEYAGILPLQRQVQTHQGLVPYPHNDEPLWLVVSRRPVFRFMGQGHETGLTWEWSATVRQWNALAKACGVWALIYGPNGERLIAQCAPPTGSQGYRYIAPDGRPVPGDETIAVRHGLHEWTDLSLAQDGSLLVGQGGSNAAVWADGQLRLLHRAAATFTVRSKYDPAIDVVSVSFYTVEPDGIEGWIYWLSLAELRALPPAEPVDAPPDLSAPVPDPAPRVPPPADPVPPHHPGPTPSPKAHPMKNKDQVRADINELIRFYMEPDGLNRAARGQAPPVVFNDPAITDWFTLAVMQDVEDIKRQIRTFPEWKHQHQGEPIPDPR